MTSPYADVKRDGLSRLLQLARLLCTLVSQFATILKSKYADYPTIIALVNAIEAVCALLPDAQATVDAFPSDDGLPPADPSTTPGIDPDAPDVPDPTGII